jgi:hypothetical protein
MAEGHNEPCYACGELCNSLTGDPGQWPTMLPAKQSARPFHMRCAAAMMRDAARYRWLRGQRTYPFGSTDWDDLDSLIDTEIAREKGP